MKFTPGEVLLARCRRNCSALTLIDNVFLHCWT